MLGVLLGLLVFALGQLLASMERDRSNRSVLKMIREYEGDNHRCGICWFHRMGVRHGHARAADTLPHWCWEQGRYIE